MWRAIEENEASILEAHSCTYRTSSTSTSTSTTINKISIFSNVCDTRDCPVLEITRTRNTGNSFWRSTMKRHEFLIFLLVAMGVSVVKAQFRCPEDKGFFPDPEQCDLYYSCVDGQPEERLCKDGLVFRDDNPKKDFCDLPANVPCGDRTILQEPQPSKGCPRANGYFKHEDPTACDRFVNCIDGVASVMPCPPGLIYEDKMSSCVWSVDATTNCIVRRDSLEDGFTCPNENVLGPGGRLLPHPTYPHPEDCAKFYICRNGVQPQKGQCEDGTVYNEESFMCTEPENVPGCEDYYKGKN